MTKKTKTANVSNVILPWHTPGLFGAYLVVSLVEGTPDQWGNPTPSYLRVVKAFASSGSEALGNLQIVEIDCGPRVQNIPQSNPVGAIIEAADAWRKAGNPYVNLKTLGLIQPGGKLATAYDDSDPRTVEP